MILGAAIRSCDLYTMRCDDSAVVIRDYVYINRRYAEDFLNIILNFQDVYDSAKYCMQVMLPSQLSDFSEYLKNEVKEKQYGQHLECYNAKRGLLIMDAIRDIQRRNQVLSAIGSKESIGFKEPRDCLFVPIWHGWVFGKKR
ncbi:MAG: hypothetical protein FWG80_03790 [Alphaproteobacteria bacterium]|nr:hypothetical protein [Alphaproteobacteria bacterium]